ncbi:hypothetical protein Tco_1157328 [Tanacetum coccineum]
MKIKDTLSSCSDSEEQEMQQMQDKAKEICMSSETEFEEQNTSNNLGIDADADDVDIKPVYDEEPMIKVQLTIECNVFSIGQQHVKQPEFNNEGGVDQDVKQCHDKRPLLAQFASQVDVHNDLSKPVTSYYLPKVREYVVVKPHHVISSSESRYSSKNMSRFSSNDMVHNHYLDEARKKTQESGRNLRPSVVPSARSQSTANGRIPKPRINNQKSWNWLASKTSCATIKTVPIAEHSRNSRNFSDSKYFVCSTCQKCVFNANYDSCVTKFLNEVNSHSKVPSHKITQRYKPIEQISIAKKPER